MSARIIYWLFIIFCVVSTGSTIASNDTVTMATTNTTENVTSTASASNSTNATTTTTAPMNVTLTYVVTANVTTSSEVANTTMEATNTTTNATATTTSISSNTTVTASSTTTTATSTTTSTTTPAPTVTHTTATTVTTTTTSAASPTASTAAMNTTVNTTATSTATQTAMNTTEVDSGPTTMGKSTTMAATTTPVPLMVTSIIEEVRQALNRSNSSISAEEVINGVAVFVGMQSAEDINAFAATTAGMAIGEIVDANVTAVLEGFATNQALKSRNSQIYFYAILVDLESQANNTNVTDFFLDPTNSTFNYTLGAEGLLDASCARLKSAGGELAACPQDTTVMQETTAKAETTTQATVQTTQSQTTAETTTAQPLQVSSINEQIGRALQQSSANNDVNSTELIEGVIRHVENQTDTVVDDFVNTTSGSILKEILVVNSSAILGQYDSRIPTINRKTYFYGVLVDVETRIENTQVINYFINTSSTFAYKLDANALLSAACSKLEAAGGSHQKCPVETGSNQNLGLIIGCSVGGVALLAAVAGGAWYATHKNNAAGKVFPGDAEGNGRAHSVASSRSNVESRQASTTPPPTPPRVAYA